ERHHLAAVFDEDTLGPSSVEGGGSAPPALGGQALAARLDQRRPQAGRVPFPAHCVTSPTTLQSGCGCQLPPGVTAVESSPWRRVGPAPPDGGARLRLQSCERPRSTTPRRR